MARTTSRAAPECLVEDSLGLLAADKERKNGRREGNEVPDRNGRIASRLDPFPV